MEEFYHLSYVNKHLRIVIAVFDSSDVAFKLVHWFFVVCSEYM